jgi:hypothetical protein
MFDLFGARAELEVILEKAAYLPGDTVRAKIVVRGVKDLEVQSGRVELRYRNWYLFRPSKLERQLGDPLSRGHRGAG